MTFEFSAAATRIVMASIVAVSATSAAAQQMPIDSIDQTDLVERINEDSIAPALAVVTGNQLTSIDPDGNPVVVGTATNGLKFAIKFRACDEPSEDLARHCRGVYLMSAWDPLPSEKAGAMSETMSNYRNTNPTVNAGLRGDNSPYIVRYVIADFGTKQGNLVSEFANFIRSATDFQNAIAPFYSE